MIKKQIGCVWTGHFVACSECELNRTMFECNMFLNEYKLKKSYGRRDNIV